MHRFSYRALPLLLSLVLLVVMGVLRPDGARAFAADTTPEEHEESAEPHLSISDPLSFGEMELRVLSDCSLGHCAPKHSITWGDGETLELTSDQLNEPIDRIRICDLDQDGDLELALSTTSCGSGRYGAFLLLEWSGDAWRPHKLCDVPESKRSGSMGHERIVVWDDHVEVTFPLYSESDPNCCPTAGYRSLNYVFEDDSFQFIGSFDGPPSKKMNG